MNPGRIKFEDLAGYDQMMGVWSQLVGNKFLEWLAPEKGQKWIDIGYARRFHRTAYGKLCTKLSSRR